jgi:hypothetical protein
VIQFLKFAFLGWSVTFTIFVLQYFFLVFRDKDILGRSVTFIIDTAVINCGRRK